MCFFFFHSQEPHFCDSNEFVTIRKFHVASKFVPISSPGGILFETFFLPNTNVFCQHLNFGFCIATFYYYFIDFTRAKNKRSVNADLSDILTIIKTRFVAVPSSSAPESQKNGFFFLLFLNGLISRVFGTDWSAGILNMGLSGNTNSTKDN